MSDSTEIVQHSGLSGTAIATRSADELTVSELVDQVQKIQQALKQVMDDGTHYGVIPGTDKPTLYKPGAEKLCLLFRLAPDYEVQETREADGHYTVRASCRLTHQASGHFVAAGEGLCTTHESKYAFRRANRVCPACGKDAIIRGKEEFGGGWLCFKKKGGCGAKFGIEDPAITNQPEGDVPNERLADSYNTVLKMACKRALIAAVLNGTAASDIFTQDLEDFETPASPPASPPTPEVGTQEQYYMLLSALEFNSDEPKLWSQDVVLANAIRRFGRPIATLQDLSGKEMEAITSAAHKWREDNPLIVIDEEEG